MAILAKWEKQPGEVQDYDISFVDWLAGLSDTASSIDLASVDTGITLVSSALVSGVVKVWLSGGTDGTSYKVTVRILTAGGRKKEDEIVVMVRER
jgi:hypothetical protein